MSDTSKEIPDDAADDIPFDICDDAHLSTEPIGTRVDEDMSRRDGPQATHTDTSLGSITGWHPFLRFVYRVADMMYAFIPDRKRRVHAFIEEHPKIFMFMFWCDWCIVLVGSLGVIAIGVFAILRTIGLF